MERVSVLDLASAASTADEQPFALGAGEILLGRLDAIDESGNAVVSSPGIPLFQKHIAMSTVPVLPQNIGSQIAMMFTQAPNPQPIIVGFIYSPLQQVLDTVLANTQINDIDEVVFAEPILTTSDADTKQKPDNTLYIDGKHLVLDAHEEISLRCGEASITLHKSGKISIRGKYLLSRATGVNRILGGSVQVN